MRNLSAQNGLCCIRQLICYTVAYKEAARVVASGLADVLSGGIYTRSQAAHLARLRPQTLRRWFENSADRGPAVRKAAAQTLDGDTVSFVDMIQLMAVRAIRVKREVSLQKIRQATTVAEEAGFPFPLARENTRIFLCGDTVFLKLPNDTMMEATGPHARHYVMEPVLLPYLRELTFDEEGMAKDYRPAVAPGVLLAPTRQWGAPIMERSNYTVSTLVSAAYAEGSIDAAARICGVPEDEVRIALQFEDFLRGAA
jgi:hypothetical protein